MPERSSSSRRPQGDSKSAFLIAALDHSWTSYDARLNRGLQVVNYYLVAIAILANAYVSAFNAKLYTVAVVIALSGLVLTAVTFAVGFRQRQLARLSRHALVELQGEVAARIGIGAFRIEQEVSEKQSLRATPIAYLAIALAALLSVAAVAYAVIH